MLAGLGAVPAGAEPGHPLVAAYGVRDLGSAARAWSLVQDGDGTLCFGSRGLLTFDGQVWRRFDAGYSYGLMDLDRGPDGRLWTAAIGEIGWFARGPAGAYRFTSLVSRLPDSARPLGAAWYVFGTGAGAIFVTENRILWWDGSHFTVRQMAGARRLVGLRAGGQIFVDHAPTGLYRVDGTRLTRVLDAARLPGGECLVLGMYPRPGPSGGYLLVTTEGLENWRGAEVRPFAPEASAFIRRHDLSCVTRLRDGRWVLGTITGGALLLRPDGAIERILDVSAGLPTNEVFAAGEDEDRGLWLTSGNGLCRVSLAGDLALCGPAEGLPDRPIDAVACGPDGSVAVSTDGGLLYVAPAGSGRFRLVGGAEFVTGFYSTADGIWVADHHGADFLSPAGLRHAWQTINDVYAVAPVRRAPDRLLVATGGHLSEVTPGRSNRERVLFQPPDDPLSLAEGADGRTWVGTMMAGMVTPRAADAAAIPAGFRSGRVLTAANAAGDVFAFSAQAGVWLSRDGRAFAAIEGYPRRPAAAAAADGNSDLWVAYGPDKGLGACVARIHRGRWLPVPVAGLDQVGSPQGLAATGSGNRISLWIGGTTGLLHATLPADAEAMPPPPPVVAVARGPRAAVTLRISESAFARRPGMRLDSWIEGVDADWMPVGPDETRALAGLHAGRFTVRARTVAETGLVSPVVTAAFQVPPPWWLTAPSLAAAAFLAAAGLYGLYRLRMRRLRLRNLELEGKVELRTEQADKARAEAERANAAKSEFIARVSHNIRNPLHGLSGLSLALESTPLDPRQQEIVAAIQGCASSLTRLLDDVLDFAQIEAGRIALHPQPFAPGEVLRSVAAALQIDARQRAAAFVITVDPRIAAAVVADRGRVEEIVMNYATNALKYAGGGRIELGARLPEDAPGEVEFYVADEGPGFTAEQRPLLFTPFARVPATAGDAAGTGLGLALCRRLADLMNGSVGVDSEPGRGATFRLRLPLVTAPAAAAEPVRFHFRRVLLVEDVAYNVWATTAVLERLGLQVAACAGSGEDALREFQSAEFDLVVLDRQLPDCDGVEVARRMRDWEGPGRHAAIIALTAFATAEDRAHCLAAGMDGFVGKPLTPEKLGYALTRLGDAHPPAAPVAAGPSPRDFDPGLLQYLAPSGGPHAERPLKRLARELAAELGEFERHRRAEDWARARAQAHRLHGLAELVDAARLAGAARDFQVSARSGATDLLPIRAEGVAGQARALIEVLNRDDPSPQTA